ARLQVYEAAYALMERISLIDNAEMWIPLEDMLRDAVRPRVQVIGFQLLNHRPLALKGKWAAPSGNHSRSGITPGPSKA
nr:hypothetical protein [Tanacetum cinerariifolium]